MILPCLLIAPTPAMGRGVFTTEALTAGTVVEISVVIVLSAADRLLIDRTALYNYVFEWGEDRLQCCMALGYVPIYNHSYASNCEYEMDFDAAIIKITTMRVIEAGEELFINYNGNWNDTTPVWFETG
jgi:uncharacterized protein